MSGPKHPQGLNISDPHHLAAKFYLRGLLNTSISRPTPIILHIHNLGGLSNHLHFSYYPQQYSIPRGPPAIVSIINLSSCLWVASGETLMGDHSICGPWPRNSNPVTVELGTFRHSSTLPAISMDFQKIKNKAIDTISQIGQPWPATGGTTGPPT